MRRRIEVACDVDMEQSPQTLHAHAIPDGVAIRPGDVVIVHDAPPAVAFGERLTMRCRATVLRAGPLRRAWTRTASLFALTELYEVGFQPKGVP
ncbi:MAG TPA: hypothetical protein VME92_07860 [Acetobacteraceae bacterium]|nr:hypothetical protein [Acetobacteraceae bacterium]